MNHNKPSHTPLAAALWYTYWKHSAAPLPQGPPHPVRNYILPGLVGSAFTIGLQALFDIPSNKEKLLSKEIDVLKSKVDQNHKSVSERIDVLNSKVDQNHKSVLERIDALNSKVDALNSKVDQKTEEIIRLIRQKRW